MPERTIPDPLAEEEARKVQPERVLYSTVTTTIYAPVSAWEEDDADTRLVTANQGRITALMEQIEALCAASLPEGWRAVVREG